MAEVGGNTAIPDCRSNQAAYDCCIAVCISTFSEHFDQSISEVEGWLVQLDEGVGKTRL